MKKLFFVFLFYFFSLNAHAGTNILTRLQNAYPNSIQKITSHYILWHDGTRTPIQSHSFLVNWFSKFMYKLDDSYGTFTKEDILQDKYEPFFRKMYGNTSHAVRKNLVRIYWMPHIFGKQYPLNVTTINGVNKQLQAVSDELEHLPPAYYPYLAKPASSFYWRNVAGQDYLSMHSFGIAIDINLQHSNYWLWDFLKLKRPISDLKYFKPVYQNHIPIKIVRIFEKHGFFWGGNWYFYDTMHFEYRPELISYTPNASREEVFKSSV